MTKSILNKGLFSMLFLLCFFIFKASLHGNIELIAFFSLWWILCAGRVFLASLRVKGIRWYEYLFFLFLSFAGWLCVLTILYVFRSYTYYATALAIGFIAVLFGEVLFFYGWKVKKWKTEKLFLTMFLPLSVMINTIVPFWKAPDEYVHLYRVYEMTNDLFGIEKPSDNQIMVRGNDFEFNGEKYLIALDKSIANTDLFFKSALDKPRSDYHAIPVRDYSFLPYSPYIGSFIGMSIARACGWNAFFSLMMARLANTLIFAFLVYLAIKSAPMFKEMIMGVTLLPIVLQQANAVTYDSVLIASALYVFAFSLRILFEKINWKENIGSILLFITGIWFVFQLKSHAYLFLTVFPLVCYLYKRGFFTEKIRKRLVIGIISTVMLFFVISICMEVFDISVFDMHQHIGYDNHVLYPYGYFFNHPLQAFIYICTTIAFQSEMIVGSMIGTTLGYLNINAQSAMLLIYPLVLIVLSAKTETDETKLPSVVKWFAGGIFLLTFFITLFGLLLEWTLNGSVIIQGYQGRYLLPVLPLLLLTVHGKYVLISHKVKDWIFPIVWLYSMYWPLITMTEAMFLK